MADANPTAAFGLRGRQYDATCTNVQQSCINPSNGPALERTNLSFRIFNVRPYDLMDSNLLVACFRPKGGKQQSTLESSLGGQKKIEADYNQKWEVLALDQGTRHDEDASHRLVLDNLGGPLADPAIFNGGYLRPRSGIKINSITPSQNQIDGDPRVDINIIAKGFDHWIGGYGWLISTFTLGFEPKNKAEVEEEGKEAAAKRKEKANKDQGELPIEDKAAKPEKPVKAPPATKTAPPKKTPPPKAGPKAVKL